MKCCKEMRSTDPRLAAGSLRLAAECANLAIGVYSECLPQSCFSSGFSNCFVPASSRSRFKDCFHAKVVVPP